VRRVADVDTAPARRPPRALLLRAAAAKFDFDHYRALSRGTISRLGVTVRENIVFLITRAKTRWLRAQRQ
jgi:hypothetical protein